MKSLDVEVTRARPFAEPPACAAADQAAVVFRPAVATRRVVGSFERAVAALLLLLAAPVVALLSLWVLAMDGRPLLYRGRRLGFRRREFHIYKVRTLRRGAEERTGSRLLRAADQLEIPGGRFMRDGRLDELPQLWNIVRGDMSFVGPRPERPEVDRVHRSALPRYSRRYDVVPGLVGPSQLFTPHSTPKRLRAWLDNAWALDPRAARKRACLVLYTVFSVAVKLVTRGRESLLERLRCTLAGRRPDQRRLRRVAFGAALARIDSGEVGATRSVTRLLDMSDAALRVEAAPGLTEGTRVRLRLEIELRGRRGSRPIRWADCSATVVRQRDGSIVFGYAPETPRSQYVLHQYFLRESLAPRFVARTSRRLVLADVRPRAARSPVLTVGAVE